MKLDNNKKIIIGIAVAAVAAAGVSIYLTRKRKKHVTMLKQVAEEGYETAQDILFPLKDQRFRKRRFIPPYFRNRGHHRY